MPANDQDWSSRVAYLANRLRMVQADLADASEEQRRDFLNVEIKSALSTIDPTERDAFLEALQERFPAWNSAEALLNAAGDGEPSFKLPGENKELSDPGFLVERLCKLKPSLPEEQKELLQAKLRAAGIIPTMGTSPWTADQELEFRRKLAIAEQKRIDPLRILELAGVLAEFSANVHNLVGVTWRTLAPTVDVRHRTGALLNTMTKYSQGDASTTRVQVSQEVERLRQLVASLVAAVGEAGRQFGRTYNARFHPEEIKRLAQETRSIMQSLDVACWKKYVELWDSRDDHAIEKEIREEIVKFVRDVIRVPAQ